MTPMHWIAILVLYLLPVLLLFVTWCKPYPQAKWTILWGQVIVSVVFLFVYPLCAPGVGVSNALSGMGALYVLEAWTGESAVNWLILFGAIVVTGIVLALGKKRKAA
ncbi:MAG: LPXTG cell wall anchor domain-containing protein [Clostridiales bacterium]|nr:LPXTG cell wall anchor domain-containing protein [Clostridiales bacterium]